MSILRRLTDRVLRRAPDEKLANELVQMLAARNVRGQVSADAQSAARGLGLPRGTRTLAAAELDPSESPLRRVIATQIGGDAAGHMGRVTVVGVHVTVKRASLPAAWRTGWSTAILAQPQDLGAFAWGSLNANDRGAAAVSEWLSENDRVARNTGVILGEPQSMNVQIAPLSDAVRVSAHQGGEGLASATVVASVLEIARELAGAGE